MRLTLAVVIVAASAVGLSIAPAVADPCTAPCEVDVVMQQAGTTDAAWQETSEFEPGDEVKLIFYAERSEQVDVLGSTFTANLPTDQIDWDGWTLDTGTDGPSHGTGISGSGGDISVDFDMTGTMFMSVLVSGTVKADAAPGQVTLSGQVTTGSTSGDQPVTDPNLANNAKSTTITITGADAAPALTVATTAAPNHDVRPGQTITYTHRVTNTGNVPLTDIDVSDTRGITWPDGQQIAQLSVSQSAAVRSTYVVTSADIGSVSNSATVTSGDLIVNGDAVSVSVTEEPKYRVAVSAAVQKRGDHGDVVWTIKNTGNTDLEKLDIEITRPDRDRNPLVLHDDAVPNGWQYDYGWGGAYRDEIYPVDVISLRPTTAMKPGESVQIHARRNYLGHEFNDREAVIKYTVLYHPTAYYPLNKTLRWELWPRMVESIHFTPRPLLVEEEEGDSEPTEVICIEVDNDSDDILRGVAILIDPDRGIGWTDDSDERADNCKEQPASRTATPASASAAQLSATSAADIRPVAFAMAAPAQATPAALAPGTGVISGPRHVNLAPGESAVFAIEYRPTRAERNRGYADIAAVFTGSIGGVSRSELFEYRFDLPGATTSTAAPTTGLPHVGSDVDARTSMLGLIMFGFGLLLVMFVRVGRSFRKSEWRR